MRLDDLARYYATRIGFAAARHAFVSKIPRTASSRQSELIGDYVFRAVQSPAVTAACR